MQLTISLRRRLGWAGAILLLALGTAGLWTMRATHAISLSQAGIQSGLDRQFGKEIAVNGPSHLLLQSIRVKSAMVTLRDGKASFDVNLSGVLRNGKSFGIEATAAGLPEYADGALFFQPQNLDVRRLTYEGESAAEFVSRVAGNHVASEKARALLNEKARMADGWANAAAENALRAFCWSAPSIG